MNTSFTDLKLLKTIFKLQKEFHKENANSNVKDRTLVTEIPIELEDIANKLKADKHNIFYRLKDINSTYNKIIFIEDHLNICHQIQFPNLCSLIKTLESDLNHKRLTQFTVVFSAIAALASIKVLFE